MIDTKQYIESGKLEDYLSDILSPAERAQVEFVVDKYPVVANELASMSLSLSLMADIGEIKPAPYMEDRIWNEILATNLDEADITNEAALPLTPAIQKTSKLPYILTVATAILAFVTIYYIIIANDKLDEANKKIIASEQAKVEIQNEFDKLKYDYDSLHTISNVYNFDNAKMYVMKPNRKNAANSIVILIWNKETDKLYLDIKKLPSSQMDKKYNLWGITQIGGEINLGNFVHSGGSQIVELKGIKDAIRYILTQERESGVGFPTMSSVYTTTDIY